MFLFYALIERILDGRPTLFQLDSIKVVMFLGPTNVCIYGSQEDFDPAGNPGAWALVDSGVDLIRPRSELTTIGCTSLSRPRHRSLRGGKSGQSSLMRLWQS